MKVTVKLYGSFRASKPGYDHENGLTLELPDNAPAGEVLARLGISKSRGAVLSVDYRIVRPDHPLKDGDLVKVMQLAGGG
ncbi:MAG: MoaD/ThiS family protein [Desulfobacteraceae bacterium]|nr:MoaD/ThiS family protein [Desulfobacteraceae bacterium]MCF8094874.1 MoaD/ThiS family protein [Desulfobacteraceae bacterium]